MVENDDDRRFKLVIIKIVVWVLAFNMIELMLGASGNVTMRDSSSVPEHTLYVVVLLYVASAIWEYYDPMHTYEIEADPTKRISLVMGYAFMISFLAFVIVDALLLPIGIWLICLVFNC